MATPAFLTPSLDASRKRRDEKLAHFEKQRIARSLVVPTDDNDVKQALRLRQLPICLFGEDAADRRERLRQEMAEEQMRGEKMDIDMNEEKENESPVVEEYFTEGGAEVYKLRNNMLRSCLEKAAQRLKRERWEMGEGAEDAMRNELKCVQAFQKLEVQSSVIGDRRPICAVSTDGKTVITGGWGGQLAVWNMDDCEKVQQLPPHNARVSNVEVDHERLITCSADGSIRLYSRHGGSFELKAEPKQHVGRVCDAKWHRYGGIISGGMDGKIILWKGGTPLYEQTSGHTGVYRISIHPDDSIFSTSGLEGGIRLWDIRTSRAVMTLTKAHATEALCTDFHRNGHMIASGGGDSVVKIWDIRRGRCMKTIAAHGGVVSSVRFSSEALITAGYDCSVRAWGVRRAWGCIGAWTGGCRIMSADAWTEGVVVGAWDRTWKVLMTPKT